MEPTQGPQMEDFSLKERRHFAGGARGHTSSLGLGLVPAADPLHSQKAHVSSTLGNGSSSTDRLGGTVNTSGILQQPDARGNAPSGQWQTVSARILKAEW